MTHRFVEKTGLPVLILSFGTVAEAITEGVGADAAIATLRIGGRAGEVVDLVVRGWTLHLWDIKQP